MMMTVTMTMMGHGYDEDPYLLMTVMMTVMMTMMGHGYDEDPYLIHIRFIRPDWRGRGRVVIIIIMTVGDAEDAR